MIEKENKLVIIALFLVLAFAYYLLPLDVDQDGIFLSAATFLFSIFAGFFIARQGKRYSAIREEISAFDGNLSFIYRAAGHVGSDFQGRIAKILRTYYTNILRSRRWDYNFTHKSTTLTDIHKCLEEINSGGNMTVIRKNATNRMLAALLNTQIIRKHMVALHEERVPKFQWILIYLFVVILIATVSTLSSEGFLLASVLKSAFVVSVISVVIILRKLDNLSFFEGVVGEHSARDVINIMEGTK